MNNFGPALIKSHMPEISAVIITLNEERNIERCLNSLQGVQDEIIVVDSYSTDRTEEICRQYGVHFIRHTFEGYVGQRRFSFMQARCEFILVLDADEALSPELRASILAIKKDLRYDGYYFNRLTNYCGQWIRHGEWYPDRKLRLLRRDKAMVTGQKVHEEIHLEKGCTMTFLKGDLLHYSYYTVEEHISQLNRFTTLQAEGNFEAGVSPSWLQILGAPFFKFLKSYIFRLGFLDGYYGFLISKNSAYSTFLKHAKLKALYRNKF